MELLARVLAHTDQAKPCKCATIRLTIEKIKYATGKATQLVREGSILSEHLKPTGLL